MVSGIHGINSPILHDSPIIEEYDGILDEARVAIHEWLTRLSIFSSFKLIFWIFWLITQRINPIAVIIRHARSMKRHQPRIAQLANVTLVHTHDPIHNYITDTDTKRLGMPLAESNC